MNNKNKVLKILDKYRDMSLTMGCEVNMIDIEYEVEMASQPHIDAIFISKGKYHDYYIPKNDMSETFSMDNDELTLARANRVILGHPATPLTLLKALEANYKPIKGRRETRTFHINGTYTVAFVDDIAQESGVYEIQIPDVTTLSEIPEEDKMWQAVLDVLI